MAEAMMFIALRSSQSQDTYGLIGVACVTTVIGLFIYQTRQSTVSTVPRSDQAIYLDVQATLVFLDVKLTLCFAQFCFLVIVFVITDVPLHKMTRRC